MSDIVVLDASALLALTQREPGGEVIEPLLKCAMMSTLNIAEVIARLQRINVPLEEARGTVYSNIPQIVDFTREHVDITATLYPHTKPKGLSLADRACLALGKLYKAPIYTADKIWATLDLGLEIRLIR